MLPLPLLLVDLHSNLGFLPVGSRTHNGTDCLGDSSLFADNPTHIVWRNMQVIDMTPSSLRFVNSNVDCILVIYQAARNRYNS